MVSFFVERPFADDVSDVDLCRELNDLCHDNFERNQDLVLR